MAERDAPPANLFHACRLDLGLSAARPAAILGLSDGRTIRYWEREQRPIPGPVWLALLHLVSLKGSPALADKLLSGPLRAARDYLLS